MAAQLLPLYSVSSVLHGAVCISPMNVPRLALELSSSSSQAFQSRTHTAGGGGLGRMKAYGPNSSSSATTVVHAQLQAVEGLKHLDDLKLQQHNQVKDFVIPKFVPPFYHKRNPLEREADQAAQQWFHHYFGNTTIDETFDNIKKDTTQIIPVSVHSTAELSRLEWAFEFYRFLYAIDDVVDCKARTSTLEDLEDFFVELMVVIISSFPEDQILKENLGKYFIDEIDRKSTKDFPEKVLAQVLQHSEFDERKVSAVCAAFSNLWSRATSKMSKEWSLRYAHIIQESMLSQFFEARNIFHKKEPSVSTYMFHRHKFGFMTAALAIVEYVDDVFLPNTLYFSSPMQRLLQATGDVACWHNDIYSFQKEFMSGELYNLVIILAKEEGTSYNETAELVNQMIIDKLDEVQSAIIELRALSQNNNDITPSQIAAIEQYIIGCTSLISATHEYHSKSARFQL
ncbi:hypothetical protein CY35_13G031600 [Sphagnum magellanicum]|nr:hypothetical protein CY35_13G031600 [Sphagnum magellanicum]